MPNSNIIVGGSELEGNISSCRTEVNIIHGAERTSLFYVTDVGYATNNCTGVTDMYRSWELSGTSVILLTTVAFVVIIGAFKMLFD